MLGPLVFVKQNNQLLRTKPCGVVAAGSRLSTVSKGRSEMQTLSRRLYKLNKTIQVGLMQRILGLLLRFAFVGCGGFNGGPVPEVPATMGATSCPRIAQALPYVSLVAATCLKL